MPTLIQAVSGAKTIRCGSQEKVVRTVAGELAPAEARITEGALPARPGPGEVLVAVEPDRARWKAIHPELPADRPWMLARAHDGAVEILASAPHLLYYLCSMVTSDWKDLPAEAFGRGKIVLPTFSALRPVYDLYLTQHARTIRDFDPEDHIRNLARLGLSHVEVNGLAFAVPAERGPKGEVLHRFYTYCPALDQFVASRLNRGIYDQDYLQANLNFLKSNADIAEKYGLTPGLVCFEPRSVPDELLETYPMLRGARVDHPVRSFHPRYNLSVAHPVVREHYAEMMTNLMKEVPRLSYISVWSNDSGSGFEYTNSLYVGRNGGGYVIREWKGDREIAEAAAHNIVRFMKTLRDAGRTVNPEFRTVLRLEPFWTEYDHLWEGLEEGIDVEVSSLLSKGWSLAYKHPKYDEVREIHWTAAHNHFSDKERAPMDRLREKGSGADIYFCPGTLSNHEPILGIPFPRLVHEKLRDMAAVGVQTACYCGSAAPPGVLRHDINAEVVRAFQADAALDLEEFLGKKSAEWIGGALSGDLRKAWELAEEAFRSFPIPIMIYAAWGVWYRLLVRPIVPDIEAIPESDRAYYEEFLLSTPHNKSRVDFRYDVGFDLIEPAHAEFCLAVMDRDLFPALETALALLASMKKRASSGRETECVTELSERMRALKCWYRTQRNVTAWVAGVHGYLESDDPAVRARSRRLLRDMVLDEIANTEELLRLWETSVTNWMIVSDTGETTFIYYKNMGEQLARKIRLMRGHEDDEPRVDPGFQWRVPGFTGGAPR